ncbi:MAG: UvrD-helicase domain-containing protein [Phycisphaerae bacterium]|nr:UvrD-helicase domain-containing protein [Phycisphaerae bacterium]
MTQTDLTRELNHQQRQVVEAPAGPMLVLAGAGTGKTRVITARIARLIRDGTAAEHILALTFTRKAADEMRHRLKLLLGSRAGGLTVCTFHALGFRIMREQCGRIREDVRLRVITEEEQRCVISASLQASGFSDDVGRVQAAISRSKNQGLCPEECRRSAANDFQQVVADAYTRYQAALAETGSIDIDDMVLRPVELLARDADVRSRYQRRWPTVLIDEYQDTNEGQDRLAHLILGSERDVCVVGDDDQSIYSFRGADVERIRRFSERVPGTRTVTLESNYRSRAPIVALANAVISKAANRCPKRLTAEAGSGNPVEWMIAADETEERQFVAECLRRRSSTTKWSSMAVLVRSHKLVGSFSREFRRAGIPCATGRANADGVAVLTLHQSKGLEFSIVVLPAMEDGTIPHGNSEGDMDAVEEERRLCYVGITRARERLLITSARRRGTIPAEPSCFLTDPGSLGLFRWL